MVPARLSVVTLGAREVGTLRSFYRALGWPELPGGSDEWAGFLLGGVLLAIFPLTDLRAEAVPSGPAGVGDWSGMTLACNVDRRDEVDTAFREAVAAGAVPVAAPVDRPWGGRSGYIADPEGNRWEIAWAGGAVFDERGSLLSFGDAAT
ncbi:VOC family protein [Actinoplanes sp. NPDC024001]|uniref:VOC family protein n=1 Tax=Actinoplanes sp. NPDC024001 TaxID=3154598 RepID=UPI0033CFAADF